MLDRGEEGQPHQSLVRTTFIFLKNVFIFKDRKKIISKGRGFRGGSDEKMRRMWFGLEIDVVGLPSLLELNRL